MVDHGSTARYGRNPFEHSQTIESRDYTHLDIYISLMSNGWGGEAGRQWRDLYGDLWDNGSVRLDCLWALWLWLAFTNNVASRLYSSGYLHLSDIESLVSRLR